MRHAAATEHGNLQRASRRTDWRRSSQWLVHHPCCGIAVKHVNRTPGAVGFFSRQGHFLHCLKQARTEILISKYCVVWRSLAATSSALN